MDYEKAYKAAKRLAANWIENGCEATERILLTTIFPELKENADERIRKALIHIVKGACSKYGIKYSEVEITEEMLLTYLEKQKEQKSKAWKPLEESMEALLAAIEGKWEEIKPTGYMSRRLEDLYDGLVNTFNIEDAHLPEKNYTEKDIEELKTLKSKIDASMEQKPTEKQDYTGLNDLERAIHRGFLCAGIENVSVVLIKETAQDCLAQMKPAEWSEKDEEHIKSLLARLEGMCKKGATFTQTRFAVSEDIDWLKSLRPQSHWKPSEEQMKALENAWLGCDSKETSVVLSSLMTDLKKLL